MSKQELDDKVALWEKLQLHLTPNMALSKNQKKEIDLWLAQEDVKQKQRAKKKWYKRGDKNTKYFHTCATQRHRHNKIQRIKNLYGTVVTFQAKIEEVFKNYFQ